MEAPNVILMIITRVDILFYSNVKDERRGLGSRGGQENDVGRPGLRLQ